MQYDAVTVPFPKDVETTKINDTEKEMVRFASILNIHVHTDANLTTSMENDESETRINLCSVQYYLILFDNNINIYFLQEERAIAMIKTANEQIASSEAQVYKDYYKQGVLHINHACSTVNVRNIPAVLQ